MEEEDEEDGDTDSLEDELGEDSAEDVEDMFEKPGAFLRAATKKIRDASEDIEEKKESEIEEDDLDAFSKIAKASENRFGQENDKDANQFNEKQTMMNIVGRERRTALGRGYT